MRVHRPLLVLATVGLLSLGSTAAALATTTAATTAAPAAAVAAAQPRTAVTIATPVVSGTSATITYTVNRAAAQITDRTCLLRNGKARVSRSCGTRTATTATSTTYQAAFSGLAPGSYRYTVSVDVRRGPSAQATTTFTIAPPPLNHAPVAHDDQYAVVSGTTLTVPAPGVLGNDTDADGDPLTAALSAGPAHGTLTLGADGAMTYTPASGFSGTDTFTYQANDGKTSSNVATVSLAVAARPNAAPIAADDTYTVLGGTTLTVPAPGVMTNDRDPDGDTLTATAATPPAHGTLNLAGNGSFTYTPAGGFTGTDTFTYTDSDGQATSNTATVTITVTPPPNRAPIAVDHTYTVESGQAVTVPAPSLLIGATDPDGDPLSVVLPYTTQPGHGQASSVGSTSNPTTLYASEPSFVGTDSFTYQITDDHGNLSNIATVTITVYANRPPVAVDHTYTVQSGQAVTVPAPSLLIGATDPDGDPLSVVLPYTTQPGHGQASSVGSTSNPTTLYASEPSFVGTDSFTYQITDDHGNLSNIATVTITVTP